jgi:hypothetical protein
LFVQGAAGGWNNSICFSFQILIYILQEVGEETLSIDCPLVSRQFHDLANDDHLWKNLYLVDYGLMPPNFNTIWHRQPATQKEEYYYKAWAWYEKYGWLVHGKRKLRFTETVLGLLGTSPQVSSHMVLLNSITNFDPKHLRNVTTNDTLARTGWPKCLVVD